ncbi:Zn-ribbon domain-containing protein [Natrialbaceae archaeon A-gly3]
MPHECTNCGRTFEDGSKEMLSGCPDCGGTKFQFVPAVESGVTTTSSSTGPKDDRGSSPDRQRSNPGTNGERSWPSSGQPPADEESSIEDFTEWPDSARRPEDRSGADGSTSDTGRSSASAASHSTVESPSDVRVAENEDSAQSDARSEVVSTEELPESSDHAESPDDPEYGRVVSEPDEDQPSLEDLREELNEQFESIRIVSPGQYELNLMELYNREEYIVSLQEDGRYVIDVPESWHEDEG